MRSRTKGKYRIQGNVLGPVQVRPEIIGMGPEGDIIEVIGPAAAVRSRVISIPVVVLEVCRDVQVLSAFSIRDEQDETLAAGDKITFSLPVKGIKRVVY